MIYGIINSAVPFRIILVVAPVAVYFLFLGLLNSRNRPVLLSGGYDFAAMTVAMSPLFFIPVFHYLGLSSTSVIVTAGIIALGVIFLAPRGWTWVIYNLSAKEARTIISRSVQAIGYAAESERDGFRILSTRTHASGDDLKKSTDAFVRIGGFPLLRNVSIRLTGASTELALKFQRELSSRVGKAHAETSPMAVTLLLLATTMLIMPMTIFIRRMPDIVRLLNDIMQAQ